MDPNGSLVKQITDEDGYHSIAATDVECKALEVQLSFASAYTNETKKG